MRIKTLVAIVFAVMLPFAAIAQETKYDQSTIVWNEVEISQKKSHICTVFRRIGFEIAAGLEKYMATFPDDAVDIMHHEMTNGVRDLKIPLEYSIWYEQISNDVLVALESCFDRWREPNSVLRRLCGIL